MHTLLRVLALKLFFLSNSSHYHSNQPLWLIEVKKKKTLLWLYLYDYRVRILLMDF